MKRITVLILVILAGVFIGCQSVEEAEDAYNEVHVKALQDFDKDLTSQGVSKEERVRLQNLAKDSNTKFRAWKDTNDAMEKAAYIEIAKRVQIEFGRYFNETELNKVFKEYNDAYANIQRARR